MSGDGVMVDGIYCSNLWEIEHILVANNNKILVKQRVGRKPRRVPVRKKFMVCNGVLVNR